VASTEHRRATIDRQPELTINQYANAPPASATQDAVTLRSSALGMRRRLSQSRTRKQQTPLL